MIHCVSVAQLGKYQLVAEIARGGMGVVYLAVAHGPARFSKLLVVKELKPELAGDPAFLEMFLEEARLAARLSHPNIVQTYEIGADGKRHFMVMDYLEGVTLAEVLRKKNPAFSLPMQLRIMCEILEALAYAHSLTDLDGTPLSIVHRDATPQNVFITFDGQVKLVDFGIAKALDSTVETRAGVLKGKPAYMAPEQISGDVDQRADLFSIGVMIWEAAVGRRMWNRQGDVEILTNIIKGNVPTLREALPTAPEGLIRICDRALAKDRADRYATAEEMQADLEAYLADKKSDVSAREVGKLVAQMFATQRASTRTTIEQHIASLKDGKTPEKVPSLRPGPDALDVLSTPSGEPRSGGAMRLADPPSFTPAPGGSMPGTAPGTALGSGVHDALARDVASRKKLTTVGLALAGVVAALVVVFAFRSGDARPTTGVAQAGSAPSAAPSELPFVIAATHQISLRVHPANARISIEGVPMSNPCVRQCTHGQAVTMHASAGNYISTDRELKCEQDETIEVALEHEPVAPASASASAGNPPPPR
jgi:serine/threonine-protein kinase